ncbi:ABC transporter substrate-binding protein [Acidovorax radicis]|uniref:ABC transporter substrate-binding protein n=1 Tax=Acidovorax radicis TaxID=758826 RepID=UPI0002377813|nr:ABC transporter substrate-binding protein [Acidovorax radicis]
MTLTTPEPLISRRSVLAAAVAAPSVLGTSRVFGADQETRSLDGLYRSAKAEGGKLVVYAGGDTPQQQDATKAAFLKRFPDVDIKIVVDYSKFHDVRIDNQLATGGAVPDVVQLQTLQDFTRWKKEGRLLPFKPEGFEQVHDLFKDPDGAWNAVGIIAFSYMHDVSAGGPASPADFIKPQWRGKMASSYPHDDDAVLFLYKLYAEAYGWDWVKALASQDIQFARGSHTPRLAVAGKHRAIGIGGSGSLTATNQPVRWAVAQDHPFMAWGQRVAILNGARNTSAAKLYVSWQLSAERQKESSNGWSIRKDVQPAGGLRPIWEYPNANLEAFPRFMENRAEVESWKQTFALYFGEVQGDPTPGRLGLRPGA